MFEGGIGREGETLEALEQHAQCGLELEARQRRTDAVMLPLAEGHMRTEIASSSANQKPIQDSGSVYKKVESWWQYTSPPMRGGLNMYMDCNNTGSSYPRLSTAAAKLDVREKPSNTGSRSCIA